MDAVTLALAKPKKIKLSEFVMDDGTNFGSYIDNMMFQCMYEAATKGSSVSVNEVSVPNFWDAVNTKGQICVMFEVNDNIFEIMASLVRDSDGSIGAVCLFISCYSNGAFFDTNLNFTYRSGYVEISVKMTMTPAT